MVGKSRTWCYHDEMLHNAASNTLSASGVCLKTLKKFDPVMAQQILGPDRDTIGFDTDGIPELFGKDNVGKQMSR